MDDVRAILTKIRVKIGAESDKEMCKFLGVAYGTLDNWKQRKQIPPKRILEFATKLNVPLEYLTNSNSFLNNTNSVSDVDVILSRLRTKFGMENNVELAKFLDIPYKTMAGWKTRKNIPTSRIHDIANKEQLDPLWILTGGGNLSHNTNSVIVNGANNGSIINTHQVKVSDELMEFVELFKEYGSAALLKKWRQELQNVKESLRE